jgi:hypothetical protein
MMTKEIRESIVDPARSETMIFSSLKVNSREEDLYRFLTA